MMITNTLRNAFALGALSLTLAACATEDTPSPPQGEVINDTNASESTLSDESLVMAETAWLSITEDGEVYTTFLDGDGRYRDVSGGEVRFRGAWEQSADRELCFTPDKGQGTCWAHKAPGLNGTMRATASDGRLIEVKKVAYTPPAPEQEAAAEGKDAIDGQNPQG